jgi:hypothetical protein
MKVVVAATIHPVGPLPLAGVFETNFQHRLEYISIQPFAFSSFSNRSLPTWELELPVHSML